MNRTTVLSLALAAMTSLALPALAHGDDHAKRQGGQGYQHGPGTMMSGQGGMIDMMRMHGQMMGGTAGSGMMPGMGGPGMMGGMGLMLETFDADGDGQVTPDELRSGLEEKLTEYDADGDDTLSLEEFETLHSDMIREMMVDRFQFLDNDGDAQITAEEIVAPAERMQRMQELREQMQRSGPQGTGNAAGPGNMGTGAGNGRMMNDD